MAVRVLSLVIVVVVVVYHALRLVATQCTGGACDIYIPFSLLLPLTAMVLAGVAGAMAAYAARTAGSGWVVLLAACAVLGLAGPVITALVLKDNDVIVWVSTVLVLSVPISVGAFAALRPRTIA